MSEALSKARERAETAFGKTQSQFMARNRIISEIDEAVQERDEKTIRLRAMRKAKEEADAAAAAAAPVRTGKSVKR